MLSLIRMGALLFAMLTVSWSTVNGLPWWSGLIVGAFLAIHDATAHPN